MLSLLLSIILGLSVDERTDATLVDSFTSIDITNNTLIKDTLIPDDVPSLVLRGGNMVVVLNTSVTKKDGITTLERGILAIDMNEHHTMSDGTRGVELVKAQGVAPTTIQAQRDALTALVSEHSVKATRKDNMGTTKDGRTITQSTWQQRLWLTHYVMTDKVNDTGMHVVTIAGYADVR